MIRGRTDTSRALGIFSCGRAFLRNARRVLRKARGMPTRQLRERGTSPVIVAPLHRRH